MAEQQYRRPYFDSSVFIAWIRGENVAGVDRKAVADHLFGLAGKGSFDIIISAWNLAEVHKKKGDTRQHLNTTQDKQIIKFIEHKWFKLVEVDRDIGIQANELCWRYSLSPADSVHLACALRAKCDVLLTWDGPLARVNHPDIRIEYPRIIRAERVEADGQQRIYYESESPSKSPRVV